MLKFNPTNMRLGSDDLHRAGRDMVGYVMDFMDFEIASSQTAGDRPTLLADTHQSSTDVSDLLTALASRSQDVAKEIETAADKVEKMDAASASNFGTLKLPGGLTPV